MKRLRKAAAIIAFAGAALVAAPASAQWGETVADTLSRHVKTLAASPKNFAALIGAGKAALQMGDAQAAAGFFGRAEEVSPGSPLPKMGMGAALVHSGEPREALVYFARAQQLGGTVAGFGAERGLAYDLLGMQPAAQIDYRAALNGPEGDEARRRLALSLAISGDKAGALATLSPLLARRDRAAVRCRSLVLALGGDVVGAKAAMDSSIPGASRTMEPFFHRLRMLSSPHKAAAVHLGVFPSVSTSTYAYAGQPAGPSLRQPSANPGLASIDQYLRSQPVQSAVGPPVSQPAPQYAPAARYAPPVQTASVSTGNRITPASASPKVWLQLASGTNPASLPHQFMRIKRSTENLLNGIDGYVAQDNDRVRLLIGPFKNKIEANIFAEDLAALDVDAFSWMNRPGQPVRKLPLE